MRTTLELRMAAVLLIGCLCYGKGWAQPSAAPPAQPRWTVDSAPHHGVALVGAGNDGLHQLYGSSGHVVVGAAGRQERETVRSRPARVGLETDVYRPARNPAVCSGSWNSPAAVVVLQAAAMDDAAFAAWKKEAPPFPLGRLGTDVNRARLNWGAAALPWLILTDGAHRVVAQGFTPDAIEAQLATLRGAGR
jgi:hypothetical protein